MGLFPFDPSRSSGLAIVLVRKPLAEQPRDRRVIVCIICKPDTTVQPTPLISCPDRIHRHQDLRKTPTVPTLPIEIDGYTPPDSFPLSDAI